VTAQKFGGPWTVIKVEMVAKYLNAFCKAIENKPVQSMPFRRIYIDGFAGSGEFEIDTGNETTEIHAGSPLRALATTPRFDDLHFIETNRSSREALQKTISGDARAKLHDGDANVVIAQLCSSIDWRRTRGVIFLDPYGASVKWETLEAIRATKALDVWYLFPLASVFRNAPHDVRALTEDKRSSITRILGTSDWEDAFYPEIKAPRHDLFGPLPAARDANVDAIEDFVHARLRTLFPSVSAPLRLLSNTKAPLYSLFFAVSNESEKARQLASRIANHLLKPR
jgi:three-Cys-motif partner protein